MYIYIYIYQGYEKQILAFLLSYFKSIFARALTNPYLYKTVLVSWEFKRTLQIAEEILYKIVSGLLPYPLSVIKGVVSKPLFKVR